MAGWSSDSLDIISQGQRIAEAVNRFRERVRAYYYQALLCGRICPHCSRRLKMVSEGRCRCLAHAHRFDPTVVFQACSACGGKARLRIRRYKCSRCHAEIVSRFLFDGLIFDSGYFRHKMADHRQRRREKRERIRQLLEASRSSPIVPGVAELSSVPGLLDALNALTERASESDSFEPRNTFDLRRYQSHIRAHLAPIGVAVEEVPLLNEDARLDRIWRFSAAIFLAHTGVLELRQEGQTITLYETHAEGQDLSSDSEAADGVEGPLGRAEV